ncbi:AmmeMemoRadiSam system protein B [Litorilinea aerophila]|uniref:AmmeMemoRadiSam system protein B n=1 Tax=Litorilinea aerophila TaxID=1204385 RepID=A0A540VH67_9CHLR|nr:AmmeMemoRadiSam system protein B [Litorilinea aerophila]MCC9076433.1 AmmeMemoRadiSam system protein B [Litorilinea aerophila]
MHTTAASLPKLRPVDVRLHRVSGEIFLLLRDPLQLSDKTVLLPQLMGAVLAYCDGTRTVEQIATAFSLRSGIFLSPDLVNSMLSKLDEACLLDNERAAEARRQALAAYYQGPCRPSLLAGSGYPDEPEALHEFLEGYLAQVPPERREPPATGEVVGLLSPHIDYPRGGAVYAQVWQPAARAVQEADLAILIGTDHYGDDPFTLTRQNYATPYGILPTDQEAVNALAQAIGEEAAFAGELRHRGEHSLELVAVWLHHMRRRQPCPVIPMLVGSLYRFFTDGATPEDDPLLNRVLDTLRQVTAGRRVVVVASGDMAHVGPAFGGRPLNLAIRARVRAADEELIQHVAQGDPAGFFAAIKRVRNSYNVCGVTPIYLTLRLLGRVTGALCGYASCPADANDQSAVTICGMLFQR